jgi:Tol biopolymer transport system component/C-terminal processing protease CtpA/Prc
VSDSARFRRLVSVLSLALLLPAVPLGAAEPALWLRYPAISPDGRTVVFSYHGNLWSVPATGGQAAALTVSAAHNTRPVWSPDGSRIAFASDRNGNFDVFVMPAAGGEATRLTFHSADEYPFSFTPDGRRVLFGGTVLDAAANVQFPAGVLSELYAVDLEGHMPGQVLSTPANYAVYDRAGKRLAYSDQRGMEMEWRKHDNSSFARDVWLWDVAADRHTRLTAFGADDRQPVWGPDQQSLYFLSERSGSFNVWRLDLAEPAKAAPVTTHAVHPVRFLSISQAGDLCYGWDGGIWVRRAGATAGAPVPVTVAADRRDRETAPVDVSGEVSEFDVSPDGGEIAFVARGEVFVADAEHGTTRRITNTPEQERSVGFSPDGRSLIYAAERGGGWKLYRTDLTDPDEPDFFNATAMKETLVLGGENDVFQPRFSPDGAEVAYLEERTALKVLNLKSGRSRTLLPGDVNYSYVDGDQWFEWSPDGHWLALTFLSHERWSEEVGLVPASGEGQLVNVTHSGFEDAAPKWARKGEVLFWLTDRFGLRNQSGSPSEADVHAAFLTRRAYDRFRLDESAFDQLKAREKEGEKKAEGEKPAKGRAGDTAKAAAKLPPPVAIEFDGLDDRIVRLSVASADLAGAEMSPDGETLYYLARFEKGYDLWKYVPRKKEAKVVAKLGADQARFALDREGKKAYVLADGKLSSVELEPGKSAPLRVAARLELDAAAERAHLFDHAWRQTLKKFHDPGMHGVDWAAMRTVYARFLPSIDNPRDFAELLSEMQGELNASHTGGRYRPARPDGEETAALGFFPDPRHPGDGVAIAEVIEGGPLEKAGTKVRAGVVIEAIDGARILPGTNWYRMLNRKADTPVRLALFDPGAGTRWEETTRPVTWAAQQRLLYLRWVRSRRETVEKLSGGRIGYAHIRGMNDGAYREVYEEVFGRAVDKEAIVLDTRFNGGGNLVEALTVFLSGRQYAKNSPRGRQIGSEPSNRWSKPSIVVMSEGNYSDAHCFPMAYTQLGLGETVGMPVPGTCTSVWWERLQNRDLVFGIPQVSLIDMAGDVMENKHLDPDHLVEPDPAVVAAGRDQQLEKAVEVLLAKLPPRAR